ncbi:MAG: ABC transporter permease subunit [Oscillospiraceae bacterium]|nr:ABC transporter permease subunit [Oscillospiraceae bacterium]
MSNGTAIINSSAELKRKKRRKLLGRIRRCTGLYMMLVIPVAYVILFNYVPMYGISIAFQKFNPRMGFFGSEWIGLYHFNRLFTSPTLFRVIFNSIVINIYGLLAGFPLPILLAIGLNHMLSLKIKKSIQFITFVPHFFSVVILVGIINQLLGTRFGLVNQFLTAIGGSSIDFLGPAANYRHLFVWSGIWQGLGYSAVLYIAALSSVDPEMHEAAIIDGASIWKRVIHIDLPTIAPTVVIMMIFAIGGLMSGVSLEKTLLMQNALNLPVSEVLSSYVYRIGIMSGTPDFSFGTAVGLFQTIVSLMLITLSNFLARRISGSGLF